MSERVFGPPRRARGSPEEPKDVPPPALRQRVFVDTTAVLRESYRLPLAVLAAQGLLAVYWTPWIAGEVARVATRENVEARLKQSATHAEVRAAIDAVRDQVDAALGLHERIWDTPAASEIDSSSRNPVVATVRDEKDRPVLAGALASKADVLLSCDRGFRNGRRYDTVVCWHPDTYLTGLFERELDVYQVVCEEVPLLERLDLLDVPVEDTGRRRVLEFIARVLRLR